MTEEEHFDSHFQPSTTTQAQPYEHKFDDTFTPIAETPSQTPVSQPTAVQTTTPVVTDTPVQQSSTATYNPASDYVPQTEPMPTQTFVETATTTPTPTVQDEPQKAETTSEELQQFYTPAQVQTPIQNTPQFTTATPAPIFTPSAADSTTLSPTTVPQSATAITDSPSVTNTPYSAAAVQPTTQIAQQQPSDITPPQAQLDTADNTSYPVEEEQEDSEAAAIRQLADQLEELYSERSKSDTVIDKAIQSGGDNTAPPDTKSTTDPDRT